MLENWPRSGRVTYTVIHNNTVGDKYDNSLGIRK